VFLIRVRVVASCARLSAPNVDVEMADPSNSVSLPLHRILLAILTYPQGNQYDWDQWFDETIVSQDDTDAGYRGDPLPNDYVL